MTVNKRDLVDAIGTARRRATLRGDGFSFEKDVVLSAGPDGLSVRSSNSAMDIQGTGLWASPVRINGAALRRLAPKLSGPDVTLTFAEGHLAINQTKVPAAEV